MTGVQRTGHTAAMMIAAIFLCTANASAKLPSSCIADLQKDYGAAPAIHMECASKTDCLFQAPTGNASALVLLGTVIRRAESCLDEAGLRKTKEEKSEGITRFYGAPGAAEQCALLTAPATDLPEGVRLVCTQAKLRP